MKRISLILSGLMAIAFTACTNDDVLQENAAQSAGNPITVTAYVAGDNSSDARITQNMDGEGVVKLAWSANDTFSVIRGGGNQTFTKASTGEDDFTGTLPGTSGTCYAVYPQTESINNNDETAVPFIIRNQNNKEPIYLMYAESETGDTYQFHHAVAYLKITFPEELVDKKAYITITTPEGIFTNGTINLTDGTLSGGNIRTLYKELYFDPDNTDAWFAIPPMPEGNKQLVIELRVAGGSTTTTTIETSKEIKAGYYYTVSITSEPATPVPTLCNLPDGSTFNSVFSSIRTTVTSIVFEANSTKTEGTQIGESSA